LSIHPLTPLPCRQQTCPRAPCRLSRWNCCALSKKVF
jgi:hypothetical protein